MISQFIAALLVGQVTPPANGYMQSTTTPTGVVEMRTGAHKFTAEGKPDVWLVGAMHVGNKQYYKDIQTLLDSQDTVLFEGVRPGKNAPKTPPPAKTDANAPKPIYKVLSDALGLEFQLTEIKYDRPGWVNSDLSMDDLDRINKEKGGGKPTGFDTVKQLLDPNSPMAGMLTTMLSTATPGVKEALKLIIVKKVAAGETPGLDSTTQDVILHARNDAALEVFDKTVKKENPPKSIGIFYGAMHMPGIEKTLVEKYGYKQTDAKWFLAASADPKKLDDQGKALYNMFEQSNAPKKTGGNLLAAALPH
ncbi:MAG: hypothetical protein BGO01_11085 [Armatimonadetes bacterium 55-13]|nr:hypothetical protein [Armatimonadota bacterium]OJU62931.1 MAG: hypothetical protein BGO01_11085 [Armatimonadetes bacterium 55-13]